MRKNNYNIKQVCSEILEILSLKEKEVISRRFGLGGTKKETLESIGKDFGITRERVRQIENAGFSGLRPNLQKFQTIFNNFKKEIEKKGNLRKEESLLDDLGGQEMRNEVYFLLTLGKDFQKIKETNDFYPLWTIDLKSWDFARKIIKSVYEKFKKINKPLKIENLDKPESLKPEIFASYLEVSKKIQKNPEGFLGLRDWPEINPKTIKDKVYVVLKKAQKPLHFNRAAELIDSALPQTVHNELIKDSRFVLIGRGIYALKEWGYQEGPVKDILLNILKDSGKPLRREEVLEKALKQRMVKENTVFLNLSNKKYFLKTADGHYKIREA